MMAGKYPDMRYAFMRGLISHERFQRSRHYLKSAAECTSRAIVSLELSESAVKSPRQAEKLEGIGGETASRLKKYADEKKFSNSKPMGGIYTSAAGAILVALLECEERQIANGHSPERSILVPEVILKRSARSLSEEELLPEGSTGFCQAWWRIEVLIKRDYIKRRSHHKSPVYTLLPLGRETAHRLRGDDDITSSVMPVPSVNPLRSSVTPRSSSTTTTTTADALYTNDSGKDGIIMLIDCSEMGGDRVALGQLCAMLDKQSVIYKTKRLASGDYGWIWRTNNTEKELPFLVERKRADDLSRSLKEGRFLPQIQKMVMWKNTFTDKGTDSMLYYLLEGHPEDYVVKCADGCQGVGMCGYPNLTQIKRAILDLEGHSDLTLLKTENIEESVVMLASITADLQLRCTQGDFSSLTSQSKAAKNKEDNTVIILDSSDSEDMDQTISVTDSSRSYSGTLTCILSSSRSGISLKGTNDNSYCKRDQNGNHGSRGQYCNQGNNNNRSHSSWSFSGTSTCTVSSPTSNISSVGSNDHGSRGQYRNQGNKGQYCNQGYTDLDYTPRRPLTGSYADDESSDQEEILPLVQHHCADMYKKKISHKKVYGDLGTDLTYIPKINKEDIPRSVLNRNHPYKAPSDNAYSRRRSHWHGPSTL